MRGRIASDVAFGRSGTPEANGAAPPASSAAPSPATAAPPAAQPATTAPASAGASPEDLIKAGEAALAAGEASKARDLFEAALHARPDEPRALLGLGRALLARRRYVEAEALYADMENRHIAAIEAHLQRARIRSLRGDHEGAKRFYHDVMQADPSSLEARLGMAREAHAQGLDRVAISQAETLVQDHPDSAEARALRDSIRDTLRPRLEFEPSHRTTSGGDRVDALTASYVFLPEEQTTVRFDFTPTRTDTDDFAATPGTGTPGAPVATDSRVFVAGLTSRLLRPLWFEARAGAIQEDTPDGAGGRRTLLIGDGVVRWDVGPRLALQGATARRALVDSEALLRWGIRVDTGEMRLEFRLRPEWTLFGAGELGHYSDGNARETAVAGVAWRRVTWGPVVDATAEARARRFNDDRDFGYLDPIRYDSEIVTVAISDGGAAGRGRMQWRVEGTVGRQDYDPNDFARAPVAAPRTAVHGASATLGFELGRFVRLEGYHRRTDDALADANGFALRVTGLRLRVRLPGGG